MQEAVSKSCIIKDILSTISTYSTINSNNPFSISLIGEQINDYDPASNSNTGGYYCDLYNRLVVTSENSELNLEFIAHELAHKVMDEIFNNDSDPYKEESKNEYKNAIKNTLLNIQKLIQEDFALQIKFEDPNNTWETGKTLSSMLFPGYLEGEAIENFIILLKQYNLNLDEQFSWFNGEILT